jgi:hypothetical protein
MLLFAALWLVRIRAALIGHKIRALRHLAAERAVSAPVYTPVERMSA